MPELSELVTDFVEQLSAAIEADVIGRVRSNVEASLGGGPRRGRRPALLASDVTRRRRKGPIQLCPVPGCKNRAAPVFGMVCADHKNVAKSKIREYREARKAARNGKVGKRGKAARAKARKARATAKPARVARNTKAVKRPAPAPKRTAHATRQKAPGRPPPAAAASTTPAPSTVAAA